MTQAAKDAVQRVTDSEQRDSELEAQLKEAKKEVKRLHTQATQLEKEKEKLVKTVRASTEEAAKAKEVRDRVHGSGRLEICLSSSGACLQQSIEQIANRLSKSDKEKQQLRTQMNKQVIYSPLSLVSTSAF